MRNYSKTVGALAAASTLVAGYASAELEGEVHVGYSNMYEFRFVDFGNDLVEAGADVSYSMGDLGFSGGLWYASSDIPVGAGGISKVNFDELDIYAAAHYSLGNLSFELGYIHYYFPDTGAVLAPLGFVDNTQEVYFGVGYEFDFGLTLGSTFYYDFDALSGWYWDTSVGYSYAINDCLSLDLAAGVGFADGHGGQVSAKPGATGTHDGYQGFYASVALPWEFREGVTLTPYVKYTNGDSGLATDILGAVGKDYLVGGVKLAVSF